jgi:hypothetical protein
MNKSSEPERRRTGLARSSEPVIIGKNARRLPRGAVGAGARQGDVSKQSFMQSHSKAITDARPIHMAAQSAAGYLYQARLALAESVSVTPMSTLV